MESRHVNLSASTLGDHVGSVQDQHLYAPQDQSHLQHQTVHGQDQNSPHLSGKDRKQQKEEQTFELNTLTARAETLPRDTSPGGNGQTNVGANKQEESASPDDKPPQSHGYIRGFKLALVIASLTVVFFLNMLDTTVLSTAIPYISDEFHSLLDIGWYGSAYALAAAVFQPLTGKLYQQFPNKWVYFGCIAIFEVGSIVCAVAKTSGILIAGRVIAGIGGAGLLNGCLIILGSCVPPHRAPAFMGVIIGIGQLGLACGPLIGGVFTQYVTWRWCFWINLVIGVPVVFIIAILHIPEHVNKPRFREALNNGLAFDIPGFCIFTVAVVMFFVALQLGGTRLAWDSPTIICLFWGAGLVTIAWLFWNRRAGDDAMVPVVMMKQRVVWVSCLINAFQSASMYVLTVYLPIYFQAVLGDTAFQSGVAFLGNIVPQLIFPIIAGRGIEYWGLYTPWLLVGSALAAIGLGLMGLLAPGSSAGMWIGFQVIFGVGRGMMQSVPIVAVQNSLPPELIPPAVSMLMFLANFAGSVAIVLCQTIFTNSLISLVPQYAPTVNPEVIVAAGTNQVREVVSAEELPGVLIAYSKAIGSTWYFSAAITALPFFLGWLLGFQDIRKRKDDTDDAGDSRPLAIGH